MYWTGVELAAAVSMYSLIITAKRNDDDPRPVLGRIGDHPASDLGEPFWLA